MALARFAAITVSCLLFLFLYSSTCVAIPVSDGNAELDIAAAEKGGLKRFSKVDGLAPDENLFRSSAPNYQNNDKDQKITPETIEAFKEYGITHVINVNREAESQEYKDALEAAGITYTPIPVKDYTAPTQKDLQKAWDSFESNKPRGTLVHCGYGDGRTGVVVTSIQMRSEHQRGVLRTWGKADYRNNRVEHENVLKESTGQDEALDKLQDTLKKEGRTADGLRCTILRKRADCYPITPQPTSPETENLDKPINKENPNAKEPENNSPTVEKGQDGELIAEAKQRSKESFDGLLKEFNYGSVVKQDKLYNELSTRLPEFSAPRVERIAGFVSKLGEGALNVGGLVLYGKAVADVFSSEDASVLDKAAVVTSILPGIGCAVQLADDEERGHVDVTHTALCFTEDALTASGFWEIALVMQVGEGISNWIQAENERSKFWDGDVLAQKGAEGWLHNVKRLINHLKGDEFFANATNQFSTYQILTLYQASQLTGDLHATHKTLSGKATTKVPADISAHVQPELKRQICSVMAESKYRLQMKLEAIALNHTAKLEREFKNQFLDDWLKKATTPSPIFGITLPDFESNTKRIHEQVEKARNTPLQLHEKEVKAAIQEVIERLLIPGPCQCDQGKKGGKCEFGDCQRPKPEGHPQDAGGRIYTTNVQSMEDAKRLGLTESCQALFTTCQAGEAGRPFLCTPGK